MAPLVRDDPPIVSTTALMKSQSLPQRRAAQYGAPSSGLAFEFPGPATSPETERPRPTSVTLGVGTEREAVECLALSPKHPSAKRQQRLPAR